MKREPVESSSITSIGYDPEAKILEIEFKDSGEVYRYFEVPADVYQAFMSAPSKGTYLNQQFKKAGYRYERAKQKSKE